MTGVQPAILYEPDGYRTDIDKLMGRQSAGNGFLRAAVAAAAGEPVSGYTQRKASAESFAQTVREFDPKAQARWITPSRPDLLSQVGHLYLPGPGLSRYAFERLRAGPHAWSLTGVTHTTASHGVMDELCALATAPVMPWDALICTSRAVRSTVETVLRAQQHYLQWRVRSSQLQWTLPQLPVIPLGVHCSDFEFTTGQRVAGRRELGIADDEVVFLFVGRLAFHAKAHPHAMYAGLQAAAKASGKKLALIQCGWFANESIEKTFVDGAKSFCPDVRCIFTDGRKPAMRAASWAASDVFVSLSDNIQETFGLTPVEAMAAGLPVIVTDWDGYKDTVRDGIDGFRIPTWLPPAGAGNSLAAAYELGADTYDIYCGIASMQAPVDARALAEKLTALATDASLRKRMGDAGRARARESLDWTAVYKAYQILWTELDKVRPKALPTDVKFPRASPARLDPFALFGHYPTHTIAANTRITRAPSHGPQSYEALARDGLFSFANRLLASPTVFAKLWETLGEEGASVGELVTALGAEPADVVKLVAAIAKMGVVQLEAPAA